MNAITPLTIISRSITQDTADPSSCLPMPSSDARWDSSKDLSSRPNPAQGSGSDRPSSFSFSGVLWEIISGNLALAKKEVDAVSTAVPMNAETRLAANSVDYVFCAAQTPTGRKYPSRTLFALNYAVDKVDLCCAKLESIEFEESQLYVDKAKAVAKILKRVAKDVNMLFAPSEDTLHGAIVNESALQHLQSDLEIEKLEQKTGTENRKSYVGIVIPVGVRPGDQFRACVSGHELLVTCPASSLPGNIVRIALPPQLLGGPGPDEGHQARKAPTHQQTFEVVVPKGVLPGQQFALIANGARIMVTCPPTASPGQTFRFQLPVSNNIQRATEPASSTSGTVARDDEVPPRQTASAQPPLTGWRAPFDWRAPAPIAPDKSDAEPFVLPAGVTIDDSAVDFEEVAKFLGANYVEDSDAMFRFSYEAFHLEWFAGYQAGLSDGCIVLRSTTHPHPIVAFAAFAPALLWVGGETRDIALIDFVCVHKERRGERMCPLLYAIAFRRIKDRGISIVVKSTGDELELPMVSLRYYHVPLNGKRLKTMEFSATNKSACLPPLSGAFRPMVPSDGASAKQLLDNAAEEHSFAYKFLSAEHVLHTLLPRAGKVITLVKGGGDDGAPITDLVSCFLVPSSILQGSLKGEKLITAYLYFFAGTTVIFRELVQTAAAAAREAGADVLNILPGGAAKQVETDANLRKILSAGPGDGVLKYYAAGVKLDRLSGRDVFIFPGV